MELICVCFSYFSIQELIQNAEDAGATEVMFLFDDASYPTACLSDQGFAKFQVVFIVQI